MRPLERFLAGVATIIMFLGAPLAAGEKDAGAVVAKGLEAMGGEANVAKHKGATMKGSGTFYGLGEGIPYAGEWHYQDSDKLRFTIEIKPGDNSIKLTQVVNGNKGWIKLNDDLKDMPADELAEEQFGLYAAWVSSLAPLKEKGFKLSLVGEAKVDGKDAVGVRVSKEGKRDIHLYFDKTSGLLVKNEHMVKDVKGGADKEMNQESTFGNFKKVDGVLYPMKLHIKRDGKDFVTAEMSEIRPAERLDAAIFNKP